MTSREHIFVSLQGAAEGKTRWTSNGTTGVALSPLAFWRTKKKWIEIRQRPFNYLAHRLDFGSNITCASTTE
jgi:hypothetical protein